MLLKRVENMIGRSRLTTMYAFLFYLLPVIHRIWSPCTWCKWQCFKTIPGKNFYNTFKKIFIFWLGEGDEDS